MKKSTRIVQVSYRNINTLHRLADNINNSPIEESVSGFTTFMQENAFRRVHLTQMVEQVILNGSTQNVIITEKTIKRPEIYF